MHMLGSLSPIPERSAQEMISRMPAGAQNDLRE
jgi:hypothetical protein